MYFQHHERLSTNANLRLAILAWTTSFKVILFPIRQDIFEA